ncbi:MAG: hypothetical protein LBT33_11220 [Spirochaetia bacterium]|nr:hypothetical protein [Spirochaetia bacterium]
MRHPAYTEHDYVLQSDTTRGILADCGTAGLGFSPAQEVRLVRSLEKARREGAAVPLPELNLSAGWDEGRQEYFVVIKNLYEPRNLLGILYGRLLRERAENPEDEAKDIRACIEKYLGVIEKKENVSLAETKEKLAALTLDMRSTLAVYEDGEYSDTDIEKLSASLDRTYFEPITELLEGIIVAIAGK